MTGLQVQHRDPSAVRTLAPLTLDGTLDLLLERLADCVAEKLAARLGYRPPTVSPAPEVWLTPQEAASWLKVPVGYTYKHQRTLGGVHVSPRVLRFPQSVLRRRLECRP